jgi:transposase
MIFAAVDWAEESHFVLVMDEQGTVLARERIRHEAFELAGLGPAVCQGHLAEEVHVAIELHSSLLLDRLLRLGVKVYGLNPKSAERARERFTPAGLKDDERDAWSLAEFLRTSHPHLRSLTPDSDRTIELQEWVGLRERLVQERTTHLQRLRSHLVNWHPQFLRAAKELNRDWALDLLERYPTADAFRKLTHAQTVKWAQGRRLRLVTVDRIAAAAYGPSPTTVPARNAAHAAEVRYRVNALRDLNTRLKEVDQTLDQKVGEHPDAFIFASFPHAGTVTVAAMLAGFGDDRTRWDGHEEVAARWGVVPVTVQSGKHRSVHRRTARDATLHQAWLWFAFNTIRKEGCWAREDYQSKRQRGAEHYTTLRAVADTWVKISYRCWYDRVPYDEALHRRHRAERQAPRMDR